MNVRFEELFSVEFRHKYYGDQGHYNGITVKPSEHTSRIFLNYGLVFKNLSNGFKIGYDTGRAGSVRTREEIVKDELLLIFRLDLTDQYLYNYTGNLPDSIGDLIFHFWNYNLIDNTYRKSGILQKDNYVGGNDMNSIKLLEELKVKAIKEKGDSNERTLIEELKKEEHSGKHSKDNIVLVENYLSKPFGQISIKLNPDRDPDYIFATKFILQFASLATHWQYILHSDYLRQLNSPAIINKLNQAVFDGPTDIILPDGKPATSFVSRDPIALSNLPQRQFKLVDNYGADVSRYKEIITVLPDPDIKIISNITGEESNDVRKKCSNIIL